MICKLHDISTGPGAGTDHQRCDLVLCCSIGPPAGVKLGERVTFEGIVGGSAATPNQLNKQGKKALDFILTGGDFLVR